jgi:hypothetical protein
MLDKKRNSYDIYMLFFRLGVILALNVNINFDDSFFSLYLDWEGIRWQTCQLDT